MKFIHFVKLIIALGIIAAFTARECVHKKRRLDLLHQIEYLYKAFETAEETIVIQQFVIDKFEEKI